MTLGVALIVVAAVVAGFAITGGGTDTRRAWIARAPVPAGAPVDPAAFEQASVVLPDPDVLVDQPAGVATRSIAPGEVLTTSAVAPGSGAPQRRVTLPISAERLPVQLRAGDTVDIWDHDLQVLSGVMVQRTAGADLGEARVEVSVPADQTRAAVRAASSQGLVVVVHP